MAEHIDHPLTARACLALIIANARFWFTVAPHVRKQLNYWEQRARAIPDATLQALALAKLHDESFNAEVAATLATLAPSAARPHVIEAIVALEVMYDYLDGLTEQRTTDPLRDGGQLFTALSDAVKTEAEAEPDYYRYRQGLDDDGYLQELRGTVQAVLTQLPATQSIADVAASRALRCAEAQVRIHAAHQNGVEQLQHWATSRSGATTLEWREFLAATAASVLALHALIALAANPHATPSDAAALDSAYLSISALSTMLDSVIDYEDDRNQDALWYLAHFPDCDSFVQALTNTVRDAITQASGLVDAPYHLMTLTGVVAYYASAPAARSARARPLMAHISRELRPLIVPTMAVMRGWRLAKRARTRWQSLRSRGILRC